VLLGNTLLLGVTMMGFSRVGPGTPVTMILALSFAQGFFASLQFTSMNSLVYADVTDRDASKAASIASTAQQLALSFGVAVGSLTAAWFLGHVDQTDPLNTIPALHKAFLALGSVTIVSSLTFWGLSHDDGLNVSQYQPRGAKPGEAPAASRA